VRHPGCAALSSVAGVYLVSDPKDGKLYVGSATGTGGIWGRWSQYIDGKVGKNKHLVELVGKEGVERAEHFRFSVLEIADTHASHEDVLQREQHWMKVLMSSIHGYNHGGRKQVTGGVRASH
jgi:hypothetical protein